MLNDKKISNPLDKLFLSCYYHNRNNTKGGHMESEKDFQESNALKERGIL